MAEKWVLKTADGQEYALKTCDSCVDMSYDGIYNLLQGVAGQHGSPVSILSDPVPFIAGAETRRVVRGVRSQYMPILITGVNAADFHRNFERIRTSLMSEDEHQLWDAMRVVRVGIDNAVIKQFF